MASPGADSLLTSDELRLVGDRDLFRPMVDSLLNADPFMLLADYQSYLDAQARVETAYRDVEGWTRSAILNVARCGFFSSDRAMHDYLGRVWHVPTGPGARTT